MEDRRVRRTRRAIGEAFVALVLEKGYERVTVQDVLDRADVGRSTFYAHFRDKESVLIAAFDGLRDELRADLAATAPGAPPDPTGTVGAVFAHAYGRRAVFRALCGRQGGNVVHRHLRRLVGDLLREHLRPHLAAAGGDIPVDVAAEFYTSAALGLLTWWVDHDFRPGPVRMARLYQRLAAPGLLAGSGAVSSG
ncbi:MAG TPA: TetR/AcrR family transcriptional regulator [Micromonosporaceae bacterium]|nr:TetR/AcrR family transcriptional regulator [Micromonosporaceae bacterium]